MKLFTKTALYLVLFLSLSQVISAQTVGKSAWMIGGAAALDITKYKEADESTTSFLLAPNVGCFIADDLALGLSLFVYDNGVENSDVTFNLGPYVRYYFTNPLFVEVNVGLGLNEGAGTSFGAKVGYSWFLNNGVAIEPALYYTSFGNEGDLNDYSSFGLSIGVQAFLHHDHGME